MAQPIKYDTASKTTGCCIRKGNYNIGVVQNYEYGPTSGSAFWAGYTIPTGGFVSYQNKSSQGPSIYTIPTVNDIVNFGKNLNIGDYSTPQGVITACAMNSDIAFVNIDYPEIPLPDNNILTLDAGYTASYPWSGSSLYSVAGGSVSQGFLSGGTTWVSGTSTVNYSNSYLMFNSSLGGQYVSCNAFSTALQEFTIGVWLDTTSIPNYSNQVCVVGQRISANFNDVNFAIRGNGSTTYQGYIRLDGIDYSIDFDGFPDDGWANLVFTFNGSNQLTAYLNGVLVGSIGGPSGTLVSSFENTIIGGSGDNVNTFEGFINSVNIYDTALNSTQVAQLYNNYKNQRGF